MQDVFEFKKNEYKSRCSLAEIDFFIIDIGAKINVNPAPSV